MRPNTKRLAAMSIATAAVAAGAPASADAAANPDHASVEGIISSYLGPLGLRDDFNKYLQENQVIKLTDVIVTAFNKYLIEQNLAPPPGLGGGGSN